MMQCRNHVDTGDYFVYVGDHRELVDPIASHEPFESFYKSQEIIRTYLELKFWVNKMLFQSIIYQKLPLERISSDC